MVKSNQKQPLLRCFPEERVKRKNNDLQIFNNEAHPQYE